MKISRFFIGPALLSITVLFQPVLLSAQEVGTSIADYGIKNEDFPIRYGLVPFLAAEGGYMSRSSILATEGVPTTLKLLLSGYFAEGQGVLDLGVGRMNQKFSQSLIDNETLVSDVMEVGLRFQAANRWQFGLVGNTFFDRGERFAANQADVQFAGLAIHKEFNLSANWVARAGVKVMNDVNIDDADVQIAALDLQIGWNFSKTNQGDESPYLRNGDEVTVLDLEPTDGAIPTASESDFDLEQTAAVVPAPAVLPAAVTSTVLDKSSILTFASGSREVPQSHHEKLAKLGALLEQNQNLFERVELIGHADKTGPTEVNEMISVERAQSVREVLAQAGLANEKISIVGRGDLEPLIQSVWPHDLQANRRVEIRFYGVKDMARLESLMGTLE